MEMRKVLAQTLDDLMAKNENIVLIDADLSKPNGLSGLKDKYPKRAMDVGIAEQNMACEEVRFFAGLSLFYVKAAAPLFSFAGRYDILFPKKRRDQRGDDHAEIRQGAAGQRL